MKNLHYHFILAIFLCSTSVVAQLDSIQQLPEVLLTDSKLVHFSKGFKVEKVNDSIVERNATSLTETLTYNSLIYFKENGFGMVSSPSFRGTNASQTAVIWNGININSIFTGQTDFNVISPLNYDNISIRSGGGGVQYGSGAVGGSIHLNNTYTFKKTNKTNVGMRYGSFSTIAANANTTQTWDNHYLNVGVDFLRSENDYDYVGKGKINKHGQFLRFSAKVNEARRIRNGVVTWNSKYVYSDRNFSGSLNTIGKDAYKDIATRNLWQLQKQIGIFKTKASFAHLYEQFRYIPDSEKSNYDQGQANSFIGGLQTEVLFKNKIRLNGKAEYTLINGNGDNVGDNSRRTLAAVLLLNHKVSDDFNYGVNIRKEFLNDYDNPILYSADAKLKVSDFYSLRINGSKNYRIPTFNDLYWYAGGNIDLKPETSYQVAFGQQFSTGNLKTDVAVYYITSEDLIKWVPKNGGIWEPENISETRNFGAEVTFDYTVDIGKSQILNLNANYSYTKAEDLKKEKQLIYVPFHKATGSISYSYKKLSIYLQGLFNGEAYTTTDNSDVVDAYSLLNLGVDYTFPVNPNIKLGGRVKNVFNKYYENVAYRPMPSRSVEIFLNFNI
ncbi:TonB-dependent receptor [Aequorivita xiaoshiensis]|uniref:TonB-dependent receptor n=1 Tax=Aequorivita xiaoshiensis TaxID=2874476 RepID=A0A9X1U5G0_9FLAO|nr:TonB-dependent receptor [Aequorivita xiaoshiensis]MCG2430167.1 TonB-dependent receptor [Aequorivita xiaoshiensis]